MTQTISITPFENNPGLLLCSECKKITIISDSSRGDTICEYCGLIISEKALDISHFEKNMFSYEEIRDRARSGVVNPLFTPNHSFNTIIIRDEIKNKDFKRIARLDYSIFDSKERNLLIAIRHLKLIGSKLKLSYYVKSHAILIYRKALKKGLIRGRSINEMICACVYFACRTFKIPISFQEIVNEACVKRNKVRNCYTTIIKELKLKVIPLVPDIFISRYISELKLTPAIERKVLIMLQFLKQFLMGKTPKVICASLIYLVCKKSKITLIQKEIAEIIDITDASLRYTYKQIEAYLLKKQINVKLDVVKDK